jgi:glutathione peroxidase-family protein
MKGFLAPWLAFGLAATLMAAPEVGKPAPDFTLRDLSGKEHSLAEYKGKTVVLEWINFGCPFVKKHYGSQNMQKLQKETTGKGIVWLSICSSAPGKQGNETPGEAKTKLKEYGSSATAYLVDEDGVVGHLYDAKTTPDMYIINPEGTLVYMGAIDDNNSPDPAVLPDSKNFVKAALDESLAGKPVSMPSTKSYGCSVKY